MNTSKKISVNAIGTGFFVGLAIWFLTAVIIGGVMRLLRMSDSPLSPMVMNLLAGIAGNIMIGYMISKKSTPHGIVNLVAYWTVLSLFGFIASLALRGQNNQASAAVNLSIPCNLFGLWLEQKMSREKHEHHTKINL